VTLSEVLVSMLVLSIGVVSVAALFPIASARFGMQPILFGFASVCVLAWALVFGCLPETKGVALEDIDLSAAGGGAAVAGAKK
jgi:hypothetical protein